MAGGRDARMSSARAVPLKLAPMIGQQEKKRSLKRGVVLGQAFIYMKT